MLYAGAEQFCENCNAIRRSITAYPFYNNASLVLAKISFPECYEYAG